MEISRIKNIIESAKKDKQTTLDLSGKMLTSLPLELFDLTNLSKLYLSNNQLTYLPNEILKLKNLTELYLDYNQLVSLPPGISELKNLTKLYLDRNKLRSLPPEISGLENLSELSIISNKLTTIPQEIEGLKALTKFYLNNNQLTYLPSEISKLKNLTILRLDYNKLKSLPPEILELNLDFQLANIWDPNVIYLDGNPLENPPIEIIKNGREALISYFKSLESERKPLNEVKVLLIGDGGAGKTSLVKRIVGEEFDGNENQTQGINIKGWEFKDKDKEIKVKFWDFGGQEIMHATHQFFLSKRSLYILVLDSRRDEKVEYWLKHIRSFGGDSPVLVVMNKIDENPSFDLNRKFLQDKYQPSIRNFFRISCKENIRIEEFSRELKKEISEIKHLQTEWGKSWFNVKTRLENMNCNFITYEEYLNICLEENVGDNSSQDNLLDFLNDLGVVLHFKDISLLDTHVLEPRWITKGIYKIINSEIMAKNNGLLRFSTLNEILEQKEEGDYYYPTTRYNYIINLMKKFELCYQIDNETVLLPDLLAVPEPNFDFDFNGAVKLFIEYDFLPHSIMPRFIVKMNLDIKDGLQWRTGVVLENKEFNSCAIIKSDYEAKRIYINVNGGQKRDYFSSILCNLRGINKSFEKLKAVEKIPLPDEPDIAVSYEHLVYLEDIGDKKYRPEGSKKEYNVKSLLGTIDIRRKEENLLEDIENNTRSINGKLDIMDQKLDNIKFGIFKLKLDSNNVISNLLEMKKELKKLCEIENLNALSVEKLNSTQTDKLSSLNKDILERFEEIRILVDNSSKNNDTEEILDRLDKFKQSKLDMYLQTPSEIATLISFIAWLLSSMNSINLGSCFV